MHGLRGRAFQCFVRDTYGAGDWTAIARAADAPAAGFEAMLAYPADLEDALLAAASEHLGKPRAALLTDLGIYLVSHRATAGLRRLLRFGGADFVTFLGSLEELPQRALLAVPDLKIPSVELRERDGARYDLTTEAEFSHVMAGIVQAMADDYGALALIEWSPGPDAWQGAIRIEVMMHGYTDGKAFDLGGRAA